MGYFKVFPNLYVVLVGPPGNKKTSAMNVAYKLLGVLPNTPLSADCLTKEKLVLDMAEQETVNSLLPTGHEEQVFTPMTMMASELSEFLGAGGAGMISFLTACYDLPIYEVRTKNKGTTRLVGPYLNLLACTTPDWITTYLRSDIISGGFSRRALFVYEKTDAGRVAFPVITQDAKDAWDRVIAKAKLVTKLTGQFAWDPPARAHFEQWYNNLQIPSDETVVGYYKSKHIQLLKISMLIALSEGQELVLRKEHLEFGLALLQLAEENLASVFSGIGRNELNAAAQKVLDMVSLAPSTDLSIDGKKINAPCILEKKLHGLMFRLVDQREMLSVIQHLIDTDKIGRIVVPPTEACKFQRTFIYHKSNSIVQ